jgi:Tfp pilus assembly protein PilO
MNLDPKKFFYLLLGILVSVLAAGGGGYYYGLTQLHEQSGALAAKMATAEGAGEQIDRMTSLQHQYNRDIVPILPVINSALPREKKQTEILAQLQNIASSTGLSITSVSMPAPIGVPTSVSQTVKDGAVLALPISFQLSGSYGQLQTFLSRVENLNRFTNVTNLAISRPDKTKPIVYSISLNAYIKP